MKRQPREINSNEMYTILEGEKKEGETLAHYDVLSSDPQIVQLDDGRTFLVNDDPPTTNRSRSLEELRSLHLSDEEWGLLAKQAGV